jgi:hypothetical protein
MKILTNAQNELEAREKERRGIVQALLQNEA